MPSRFASLSALLAGGSLLFGAAASWADAAPDRLETRVASLADPARGGRAPGSSGLAAARAEVQAWMEEAGLAPAAPGGGWTQSFRVADLPPGVAPRGEGIFLEDGAGWDSIELVNLVGRLPAETATGATTPRGAILVGAHLDHLGTGPEGQVYTGADDNASGVAALLEVAELLRGETGLQRDVIFVVFDGEEAGQLGSRYAVAHPPVPIAQTEAMINLDTIGRLEERRLFALGAGSALELTATLEGINLGFGFDLETPEKGPFASDQVPYFEAGVPVVHFTTGPNLDYHSATDTAEKVDAEGLSEIAAYVAELVVHLAGAEEPLTFVPPGAAAMEAAAPPPGSAPRRVSLGTIPDFARESGGVLLSGVVPGSPAEQVDLRQGDLLIEMGGAPVDNLGDFSEILKAYQPGDEVEVVVRRGEETLRKTVTLVERKR